MPPDHESRPVAGVVDAHRRNRAVARWRMILWIILAWGAASYLIVPWVWKVYFRHHRALADVERITRTSDGHPGDPVNIGVVGTEAQLIRAMTAIGWYPADPITFRSSVRIVVDSVFRRPDDDAPVSSLYLFNRKQDLAFEQPVGDDPRQRHHVRFWRSNEWEAGRPLWLGAATFDRSVGFSHTTGEVTHHIGPDVDAERDRIANELQQKGWVQEVEWIDGFHHHLEGRNGGGDPWHTDGRLAIVFLRDPPKDQETGERPTP